ncbi:probable serine/threonine-protein kinase PBL22 [Neltuma alba]|uniref:probable serine/threonine-protein kinase PBL22 n=1 Tax=Neltuma alba TaxID=207710 RepID=UPI0010A2C544|nr:probable serine/threonine-protein kinase PBL22 [Prosopis alba]
MMEVNTTVDTIKPRTGMHRPLHPQNRDHHLRFSSETILIIIVAVASGLVLLLTIFLIIFMLRRLKCSPKNSALTRNRNNSALDDPSCRFMASATMNLGSSPAVKGGCLSGGSVGMSRAGGCSKERGVQVFTYRELQEATEGFSEANVIGRGGSGSIYRGVLSDGTLAAIKLLRRQGRQGERAFRIEVDMLSRLHSPYLVELLGYSADQQHRLLIFEFIPNGTLHQHLHSGTSHSKPLNWWTRLRIALDCARALEFLHEHAVPPVMHRDFNSHNVLLDHNFRAKINAQISTPALGTTGYLAPEHACSGELTTKSDVYSYGVVLLELLTGRVPVDIKRPPGEHVLVSWALPRLTNREKLVGMVDPVLRGHYSEKDLIQIGAIAAMCAQPEADYRPLMTDVVQSLIPLVRNTSAASFSSPKLRRQTSSPVH